MALDDNEFTTMEALRAFASLPLEAQKEVIPKLVDLALLLAGIVESLRPLFLISVALKKLPAETVKDKSGAPADAYKVVARLTISSPSPAVLTV